MTTVLQAMDELKQLIKMQAKEYLTIDEAAKLCDLKADTLKKMVKNCEIRSYQGIDGKIYVRKGELYYAVYGKALMINELATIKL